jgi:hypothetical protein
MVISRCTCTRDDRTYSRLFGCKRNHHRCTGWIYRGGFRPRSFPKRSPGRVHTSSTYADVSAQPTRSPGRS